MSPPHKRRPGTPPRAPGLQIQIVYTKDTICRPLPKKFQALNDRHRRALNALRFCIRHAALLDKPDVKALAGIVNGFDRLRSWRELRGDAPHDIRFSAFAEHDLGEHQLDRLDSILATVERRRRP